VSETLAGPRNGAGGDGSKLRFHSMRWLLGGGEPPAKCAQLPFLGRLGLCEHKTLSRRVKKSQADREHLKMKQQREMGTTPMMTTEQIALGVPVVHGVPEKRAPGKSAPEKSAPEKPSSWFPTWHGGVDYDGAAELRAKLGYPKGLAKQVCESLVSTPLHFWGTRQAIKPEYPRRLLR
jgi:hypothetical protein